VRFTSQSWQARITRALGGLALVAGSVSALTGAVTVGTAAVAGATTRQYTLSCKVTLKGTRFTVAETLTLTATVPQQVAPGGLVTLTDVLMTGRLTPYYASVIENEYHVTTVRGTVTKVLFSATTVRTTPSTINIVKAPMAFGPIPFNANGTTLVFPAIPAAVPWTADTTGIVFLTVRGFTLQATVTYMTDGMVTHYALPIACSRSGTTQPLGSTVIAPSARGKTPAGYNLVGADGGVFVFPTSQSAGFFGSLPGLTVHVDDVVGIVSTNNYSGYDLVGSDGGVFVFPTGLPSGFYGSLPGLGVDVNHIVGIVPTDHYSGYDLVGSDGGVFVFPTGLPSGFYGSLPGMTTHVDNIVGIAVTGDDKGYWLAGSTGHVYNLGDAPAVTDPEALCLPPLPSVGGPVVELPPTTPCTTIVGIAVDSTSQGGWLVRSNGAVYPFGDATSYGTLPAGGNNRPTIGSIVATPSGHGYWLVGTGGRVFAFGDAASEGTLPSMGVDVSDVVGAVPTG
jgi:hypothetical protein